ncbi:Maleylacetate reductase [Cupriavidus gilardii CR3]|uniref:Maleylacetate reductase n=1 Tax=Cupriavidus gilardii TaxID=82541 RepID=A0A849B5T0_9BURK|nr:maleylacetate reductase [Cupriavidus gilardii]ALD91965.1 Maleylacetate reductase [Cupriavidus gilardii CR3]KAB0596107.1 maleylacetate reductase [Cupriavidus gilardii]MCT9014020.1 maleylacetate reductase [Cupriavidus gilardii]MCT9052208.1 maleylacetate reductase [Cupriavidus gilardii]NNH10950.1 maleylacetate reductase [Cupriavidus gilardii]
MKDFVYTGQPGRVVFRRRGVASLGEEVAALHIRRAIVLSTPQQASWALNVAETLGRDRAAGVFTEAVMHVPVEVVRKAVELAQALNADGLIAIGGGSTIGLAKAMALQTALPIIAVPTTYAGSEMTPIWGMTENNLKRTGKDLRVLPKTVIYDPDLTVGLPVDLSMASAVNAIAHAAEGLYARDGNPVISLMAEEGIRALASSMPLIRANPHNEDARGDALYGTWLCGSVLGNVGMALHHKLCHTLGGTFNLPHAEVHALILPHAIAFNTPAIGEACQRIRRALGTSESAAAGLFDLAKANGIKMALKDISAMTGADISNAVDLVLNAPYWNPRTIDESVRGDIEKLLWNAYEGNRPE